MPEAAPNIVQELVEKRTATSREYLLSNGVTRVQYHSGPIHYRDAETGRFEPIDATLDTATVDGREVARNRANAFTLTLPGRLDDDAVSLKHDGISVRIRPARRSLPGEAVAATDAVAWRAEGVARGNYDDAFDGADLAYESLPQGVKETIVLDRAPSVAAWPFEMTLEGVTPRLERDGSISLVCDGTDTVAYIIPAPHMSDASSGAGALTTDVHYELSGAAPTWRLTVWPIASGFPTPRGYGRSRSTRVW